MKIAVIPIALLMFGLPVSQATLGQTSITLASGSDKFTVTEPGRIQLAELFKVADVVAVVHIVSGDEESYPIAIYKAVVTRNLKGSADGATIYFGQFTDGKLGSEYVLFLRNFMHTAEPKLAPTAAYGTVKYLDVFNQGYSALESFYGCVFDGSVPDQSCDYGVRVCTDHIVLPKGVKAFPPEKNDPPFGCRWVRRPMFMGLLDDLAGRSGAIQKTPLLNFPLSGK